MPTRTSAPCLSGLGPFFFFFFPFLIPIPHPFRFPLGYSGGISVPTRSPGALVLPLRPSCLSHPSPRLTTLPPPKAWACPPALFLGSPPIPTLLPTKQAQQQRSRVAERAQSTAAEQSRAAQRRAALYYCLLPCVGYIRYGHTHRQSLPCHLLTEQGKQHSQVTLSVTQSVRPPVIWVIRSTNQSTTSIKQQSIGSLINSPVARSLAHPISQSLNHSFEQSIKRAPAPFIPA